MRLFSLSAGVLLLAIGGCGPGSYEECLIDLGRSGSAADARALCREAFPQQPEDASFFTGQFYYTSSGQQCGSMTFHDSGNLSTSDAGYCGSGSLIECTDSDCWFTCTNHNRSDTAVVRRVESSTDGLSFYLPEDSAGLQRVGVMFHKRGVCELAQQAITPEDHRLERLRESVEQSLSDRDSVPP